jgi:hypothetical protein
MAYKVFEDWLRRESPPPPPKKDDKWRQLLTWLIGTPKRNLTSIRRLASGKYEGRTADGEVLTFPTYEAAKAYETGQPSGLSQELSKVGGFLENPPTWLTNPYAQGKPLSGMAIHPETTSDIGAAFSLATMAGFEPAAAAVAPLATILPKWGSRALGFIADTSGRIEPAKIPSKIIKQATKIAKSKFAEGATVKEVFEELALQEIPTDEALLKS